MMKSKIKSMLFTSATILAMLAPVATNPVLADSNGADSNTQGLVSKSKRNKNKSTSSSTDTSKSDSSKTDSTSSSSDSDKDKSSSANTSANTSSGSDESDSSSTSTTNTTSKSATATKTNLPKTGYDQKTIFTTIVSLGIAMLTAFGLSKVLKDKKKA